MKGKASPRVFLGLYQDALVRTSEGWRFARRRLDGVYTTDPAMEHRFDAVGRDPWMA